MRLSSLSWILNLCSLTFPSLCLVWEALAPLLRVRSISSVTLVLFAEEASRTRPVNAPFQIPECQPHGFVVRIPSLGYGLQHLAYIRAVFGQLHGIFVINQLVLARLSVRIHRRKQNVALTRTEARLRLTILKTSFAEEGSITSLLRSLLKMSILSSRSGALALRVRWRNFRRLGMRGTSGVAVVEVGGRFARGQQALMCSSEIHRWFSGEVRKHLDNGVPSATSPVVKGSSGDDHGSVEDGSELNRWFPARKTIFQRSLISVVCALSRWDCHP